LHDFDADGASVEHSAKERLNEGAIYVADSTFKIEIIRGQSQTVRLY
jgi:hypothetical protein